MRTPVLFIGHGSPLNTLEDNAFTQRLSGLSTEFEKPRVILCISAHWLSAGTWVTRMPKPRTIHDFYGFPRKLHEFQYAAPGDPKTAELISSLIQDPRIQLDDQSWGLDHGAWSVLTHLYPKADIPVVQLSLDMSEGPEFHFELGKKLRTLREQGVLIVGSGNIVHNLSQMRREPQANPWKWAVDFDEWVKQRLMEGDYQALVQAINHNEAARLSVPTPDHYYPLLYTLGAADSNDRLRFEYEGIEHASISMRCLSLGLVS